jgi:hypothetical protein
VIEEKTILSSMLLGVLASWASQSEGARSSSNLNQISNSGRNEKLPFIPIQGFQVIPMAPKFLL